MDTGCRLVLSGAAVEKNQPVIELHLMGLFTFMRNIKELVYLQAAAVIWSGSEAAFAQIAFGKGDTAPAPPPLVRVPFSAVPGLNLFTGGYCLVF